MTPQTKVACPCCNYLTLDERGAYNICHVCFWEDDGGWDDDPDNPICASGPNRMTLLEGQRNFKEFGACCLEMKQHCREPLPSELPTGEAALKREG